MADNSAISEVAQKGLQTTNNVRSAVKVGKSIAAAAKGGSAGGWIGAVAAFAWENRRLVAAIIIGLIVMMLIPVVIVSMLPSLIFGGTGSAYSPTDANNPILNNAAVITENIENINLTTDSVFNESLQLKLSEIELDNLISKLYIIPLYQSTLIRTISFFKLILLHNVPFTKAKAVFEFDRKTRDEKRIMKLAFSAPMSTAEIIKCVDKNISCILCEDDVVEFLYDDKEVTSDNISETTRNLPATRSVISAISNLYLRKQILFERM